MAFTKPAELTERLFVMVSPELKERFGRVVRPGEGCAVMRRAIEREVARRERRAEAAAATTKEAA
jgi:hypothetical protein